MDDKTVLGRALEIIDAVSLNGAGLTLAELTTRTGIPKPTVRRIAQDLVRRRVLTRDKGGYGLGPHLAEVLHWSQTHRRFAAVQPALAELHAQFGGIAWLSCGLPAPELTPSELVCDPHLAPMTRSTFSRGMTPETLVNTAAGRVVLAQQPEMLERVTRGGWQPATRHSPETVAQLLTTLQQIHDFGAAVETEQYMLGWRCIATTLTDSSGHTSVIGVTSPITAANPARMLRTTLKVRDNVKALI